MKKSRYIEKIQKLLYLARRSTNEYEAANAINHQAVSGTAQGRIPK
ncbi:DUF2786 domain-containing protein [Dickeya poaceiphila]|uniref:DUF2786 domain-containing protein n=1 Tax=Dickeya poaceiphila TaxID=568768 RepID=A0A5B8IGF3_9GAMM|nr:DUF2786 domain-containing protein [Dickeya poaceiphila]QDX30930.1 DUF2786 domain-containing protein [Dickeya poaceiphila]